MKKQVLHSALQSTILYGCESWLTNDLKAVENVYSATLKHLLGVRATICTAIILLESGTSGVKAEILQRQSKFIKKIISRSDFNNSYLDKIMKLAINNHSTS